MFFSVEHHCKNREKEGIVYGNACAVNIINILVMVTIFHKLYSRMTQIVRKHYSKNKHLHFPCERRCHRKLRLIAYFRVWFHIEKNKTKEHPSLNGWRLRYAKVIWFQGIRLSVDHLQPWLIDWSPIDSF